MVAAFSRALEKRRHAETRHPNPDAQFAARPPRRARVTLRGYGSRAMSAPIERDYVLGTNDEELARLGLQHRVWRPRALDAWRRAGFNVGHTLVDIGCGPGFAALDLAEIVGPSGRVVAIDRSRRFLDALEPAARARGLAQIEPLERDLDEAPLPALQADGAWARWVFAFVKRPRRLLERYNVALAQAVLLRSSKVEIVIRGEGQHRAIGRETQRAFLDVFVAGQLLDLAGGHIQEIEV